MLLSINMLVFIDKMLYFCLICPQNIFFQKDCGESRYSSVVPFHVFSSVMEFSSPILHPYKAQLGLVYTIWYMTRQLPQIVPGWLSGLWMFYLHGSHQPSKTSFINFLLTAMSRKVLNSSMLNKLINNIVHCWNKDNKILRDGLIPLRRLVLTNHSTSLPLGPRSRE